jgi:surface protein
MEGMFYGCNKLETLNVSGWDFSKAMAINISHSSPFNAISSVKTLNLTNAKF